jgi:hypothetical protein
MTAEPNEHTTHATQSAESAHAEHDHIHLPDPSIWPFVIALGSAVLLAGIVLGFVVLVPGLLILGIGVGGWVYEDIELERRSEHH